MSAPSPHGIPHDTGQDPFVPGPATTDDVTTQVMYYTLCQVCRTAFNDWTDTKADARRNRREHLAKHKRSAGTSAPEAGKD
jgi:hypothetical protein